MQKKKIRVISSLFVGFYTHQLLYKVLLIMYALKIYFSNISTVIIFVKSFVHMKENQETHATI